MHRGVDLEIGESILFTISWMWAGHPQFPHVGPEITVAHSFVMVQRPSGSSIYQLRFFRRILSNVSPEIIFVLLHFIADVAEAKRFFFID